MKAKILFIFLSVCITLQSYGAEKVKGNGTLVTHQKEITDYNKIKIDGLYDFTYTQSDDAPFLELTVDENLYPYVHVEIKNRILSIGFKGVKVEEFTKFIIKTNSKWLKEAKVAGNANFMLDGAFTGDELVIKGGDNSLIQLRGELTLGKLDLNVSGSANMVVDHMHVDKLDCSINGHGSIRLKEGTAKEGAYSITSSGDIHAFGIAIPEVNCRITGSGTAEIHPTENLRASLLGSGNIRYKGPTAVQQKKLGKGTIEEVK